MRVGLFLILALFVAAAVILTVTVPTLYIAGMSATRRSRAVIADVCAREISHVDIRKPQELELTIRTLREQYGLQEIQVRPQGYPLTSPEDPLREFRNAGPLLLEFRFPPDPILAARHPLRLAAGACIVASIAALLMLASTVAGRGGVTAKQTTETSYLFETFETSIRTMKGRESELQRLRDREKERADELAVITGTLVRSLSSGFLSIDERGMIVAINEHARALLQVTEGDYAGKPVLSALGETAFARVVQSAVDRRLGLQREEIGSEDGETLIGLTTVPLLDERDRYFGMLALFTDLMPVRSLERRLREMQSLADLGEMSAGIAHEFRNSLSTILGYLNLARKIGLSAEAEERLSRAEEEARQLNGAVEGLLAFARPMPLDLQSVDLRQLASDVVEQVQPVAAGTRFELTGAAATIKGDPRLLRRVVENIVRNALDAIREKAPSGSISIRVTGTPSPSLTITDDGVGVDPAIAAKVFLPFQSTKQNGFGLGLALAKKIVLLHGGTITLTGARGHGATVHMTFPRETASASS